MNITQDLQKWGNSSGVRIPKKIIDAAKLQPNQTLEITINGKSIVLTPVETNKEYTLEAMLEGITPDMNNIEVDWGEDIGAERIDG